MTRTPEVRVRPHETRAGSLVHRARSRDGMAVSVRTSHGQVDYVRVGSGTWGGRITHDEAVVLAEVLAKAIAAAEDQTTPRARQYFRGSTRDGGSASVRIAGPARRGAELTFDGIDYVRVGSGSWGGSICHAPAVALHAALQAALAGGEPR